MFEDGNLIFEVNENELELLTTSFSNEICSWVAVEVYKYYGDRVLHTTVTCPGTSFYIKAPKDYVNDKGLKILGVSVHLHPISENEVLINCIETGDKNVILPPNDAVSFLCGIFD